MPFTTIRVLRVDYVHRNGPHGPFKSYCVTGATTEGDYGSFQAQTTSELAASLCQRAKELDKALSVLWKDGRYGKEIVNLNFVANESAVA